MNRKDRKRAKRERLWRQLCDLYEITDSGRADAEEVSGGEVEPQERTQQSLAERLGDAEAARRIAQRQTTERP